MWLAQLYASKSDPQADTKFFESIVHWSCANADGQTDDASIVSSIWSYFSPNNAARKPLDGYNNADARPLKYSHHIKGQGNDIDDLLKNGWGRCTAWQEYLIMCLSGHGISSQASNLFPNSYMINGDLYVGYQLLVRNWDRLTEKPLQRIPAQHNADSAPNFNYHAVVSYNGKIYDPSYGSGPYNDLNSWELAGLEGIVLRRQMPDPKKPYLKFLWKQADVLTFINP